MSFRITLSSRKHYVCLSVYKQRIREGKKKTRGRQHFYIFKPIICFRRKQTHAILDNAFVFYKSGWGRSENLDSTCLNCRRKKKREDRKVRETLGTLNSLLWLLICVRLVAYIKRLRLAFVSFISRVALWPPLKGRSIISMGQNESQGTSCQEPDKEKWFLGLPLWDIRQVKHFRISPPFT